MNFNTRILNTGDFSKKPKICTKQQLNSDNPNRICSVLFNVVSNHGHFKLQLKSFVVIRLIVTWEISLLPDKCIDFFEKTMQPPSNAWFFVWL